MLDSTKKAIKLISNRAYVEGKGVNYFNLLIEYTLKIIPIEEDESIETAHVMFIDKKGFIIRYNPKCKFLFKEDDSEDIYVQKVAFFLAHEALHILFKHMSVPFDPKKDNHHNLNVAMDSQVNSYLWNMGYMSNFEKDFTHHTIVDLVKLYQMEKKRLESMNFGGNASVTPDGTMIIKNPDIDKLKDFFKGISEMNKMRRKHRHTDDDDLEDVEEYNDEEYEEEELPEEDNEEDTVEEKEEDTTKSIPDYEEPTIEGCPTGFEVVTDMPDWKKMYEFLMKNVPKMKFKTSMSGDIQGNLHSEFDRESTGIYVDRIFKGFAEALDKDLEEVDEKLRAELNKTNPLFEMHHIPKERLKSEWVRELSKHINGVNSYSGYRQTWNRFSRRLGEGYVGRTRDRYQDCSVLVDVSGSMTEDIPRAINQICEVATFIGRIKYFLTWDTEQCGEWININSNKLKRLNIGSRGGTSLGEGFKQLARKGRTKLLIVISDMETDESDYKILNELSLTHDIILGLVQSDVSLAYNFFDHRIKVIPIGGISHNDT